MTLPCFGRRRRAAMGSMVVGERQRSAECRHAGSERPSIPTYASSSRAGSPTASWSRGRRRAGRMTSFSRTPLRHRDVISILKIPNLSRHPGPCRNEKRVVVVEGRRAGAQNPQPRPAPRGLERADPQPPRRPQRLGRARAEPSEARCQRPRPGRWREFRPRRQGLARRHASPAAVADGLSPWPYRPAAPRNAMSGHGSPTGSIAARPAARASTPPSRPNRHEHRRGGPSHEGG